MPRRFPFELFVWIAGLSLLALADTDTLSSFTVCPLALLGFEQYCPGCGLGRSISYLFHGNLAASWQAHPLAIPVVIALLYRIAQLIRNFITSRKAPSWQTSTN